MKKMYEKFLSLFKTQKVEDKPYYLSYENGGVLVLKRPTKHQIETNLELAGSSTKTAFTGRGLLSGRKAKRVQESLKRRNKFKKQLDQTMTGNIFSNPVKQGGV